MKFLRNRSSSQSRLYQQKLSSCLQHQLLLWMSSLDAIQHTPLQRVWSLSRWKRGFFVSLWQMRGLLSHINEGHTHLYCTINETSKMSALSWSYSLFPTALCHTALWSCRTLWLPSAGMDPRSRYGPQVSNLQKIPPPRRIYANLLGCHTVLNWIATHDVRTNFN